MPAGLSRSIVKQNLADAPPRFFVVTGLARFVNDYRGQDVASAILSVSNHAVEVCSSDSLHYLQLASVHFPSN